MQKARHGLKLWLPLAAALTLVTGLIYVAVQQDIRQGANDPQIQMAEDTAQLLNQGKAPSSVVPAATVDLAQSLSPFIIVFDSSGKAVASSGLLHSQIPALPAGVLTVAREHGEDRVTWQPEPSVRIASVVVGYGGAQPGFVLAGRSLRESEIRVDRLGSLLAVGWLASLAVITVLVSGAEIFL
jgi:hypothetical protein